MSEHGNDNQPHNVGRHDTPQDVCPLCQGDNISNDGPPENGEEFVTCNDCGYQWHEPEQPEPEPN